MSSVGGLSQAEDATAEVQELCDKVKPEVGTKLGKTFTVYRAVQYGKQIVKGTVYVVKVAVDDDSYLHLNIYVGLQQEVELKGVQDGKSETDAIKLF